MAKDKNITKAGSVTSADKSTEVDIFLDLKSHKFFAVVSDTRYEDTIFDMLVDTLLKLIEPKPKLKWIPVIHIETSECHKPIQSLFSLGISVHRYYLCGVPLVVGGEDPFLCSWETKEEDREKAMVNTWSIQSTKLPEHRLGSHWYPYDEKLWESLQQTCADIRNAAREFELRMNDVAGIVANGDSVTVMTLVNQKQL